MYIGSLMLIGGSMVGNESIICNISDVVSTDNPEVLPTQISPIVTLPRFPEEHKSDPSRICGPESIDRSTVIFENSPSPSTPFPFSAMTPPPATTPSPPPDYCVLPVFPALSPQSSSPPPTPHRGYSPAFPATSSPPAGPFIRPEVSLPPPLPTVVTASPNVAKDSSYPNPDDMDESQLQEYLNGLSTAELEKFLHHLSDEQLKHPIPVELLEPSGSQIEQIDSALRTVTGASTHSSVARVPTTSFSSVVTGNQASGEPWEDIIIFPIRHKGRKGYDARVKQVRCDKKCTSGLSVFVQYENPHITPAAEWLDYHILRRRDNNRFIAHTGSHPHMQFRPGYKPKYILQDLMLVTTRKRNAEVETGQERAQKRVHLDESPVAASSEPTTAINSSLLAQPATPTGTHWIFNPAIRSGLGDRHLLLALKGRTDKKDQRTTFRTIDGQVKPWKAVSSGNSGLSEIAEEDIHESIKSYGMPSKPARANGLYMVCEGGNVGKTVRRLGESFEVNLQASVAPLWVVQEVYVQGKGRKYTEEIKDVVFSVSGSALALIYEQEGDRATGNAQMTSRREEYAINYMNY